MMKMRLQPGHRFRAVLFDFDGVIVHSTPVHLDGWARAYEDMFQSAVPLEILSTLVGQSTAAIGNTLSERAARPSARAELIRRKAQYVLSHVQSIPLIAGVDDFLMRLKAKGIPYGIASNAPRAFIESALDRHTLRAGFYLGLEDYKKPKPDPEPYLKGAQKLGWDKADHRSIAVFEDSAHGIEAAVSAGMVAIGVCSQHRPEVLLNAGAEAWIEDFEDREFLDRYFF